jgi:hypothetical protein
MAEFVVAIPVMLMLWFGVSYFRQGYARRLQALSDVHADAWAKAYSNDDSCFKAGAGPWQGWSDGQAQGGGTLGDGNGNPVDPAGAFQGSSSAFIYGTVRSSAKRDLGGAMGQGSVGADMFITCNELVPTATQLDPEADQNVVTPLWDFAKSFFHF